MLALGLGLALRDETVGVVDTVCQSPHSHKKQAKANTEIVACQKYATVFAIQRMAHPVNVNASLTPIFDRPVCTLRELTRSGMQTCTYLQTASLHAFAYNFMQMHALACSFLHALAGNMPSCMQDACKFHGLTQLRDTRMQLARSCVQV